MKPEAKEVSPRKVLAEVAAAIPVDVHPNIIILGSLAAGFWLFQSDQSFGVRTKDINCVLSPHVSAVEKGRAVAEKLIAVGWKPHFTGRIKKPGEAGDSEDKLPAVRLYPPGGGEWFIELLTEPASENQTTRVGLGCRFPRVIITRCPAFNSRALPPSTRTPPNLASVAPALK